MIFVIFLRVWRGYLEGTFLPRPFAGREGVSRVYFISASRLWRREMERRAGSDSAREEDLLFSPGLPMPFRENEKENH